MSYTIADLLRDIGDTPLIYVPIVLLAHPLTKVVFGFVGVLGKAAFRLGKGPKG